MVERTQDPAADHPGEQGRRGDHRQHEADPGTLADAALAELVGLDLALVVEGEDADRIELDVVVRLVPRLQRLDRIVSGASSLKNARTTVLPAMYWPSALGCSPPRETIVKPPANGHRRLRMQRSRGRRCPRGHSGGLHATGPIGEINVAPETRQEGIKGQGASGQR